MVFGYVLSVQIKRENVVPSWFGVGFTLVNSWYQHSANENATLACLLWAYVVPTSKIT